MDATELVNVLLDGNNDAVAKAVSSSSFLKLCNHPLANGQYPLHALANKKSAKGVEALLAHGANVNQESEEQGSTLGFTAAHYAAAGNCLAVLDVLQAYNADLNHVAADKWTPLHVATFRGHSDAIKKLVESGADMNCVSSEGHTPLLFAVNLGRVKDTRFFLQRKASIKLDDAHRDSLLHYALHYRMAQQLQGQYRLPDSQLDVAVLLVLNGVRPDEPNADGDVATRYAAATLPSLSKALSVLFDNAIHLLCVPTEFNYLTLVTATQDFLVDAVGLDAAKAAEMVEVMRALEAERKGSQTRKTPSPPPTALPTGHPAVPAEMMNLVAGDPSGGKCPFLAQAAKQQAQKRVANSEDERPHCPFSVYTLCKNKGTLLLMGFAFLVGYQCGRSTSA